MSEANGDPDGGSVEVGAVDADLRLWLAKEAVRNGELLLASQLSNLTAMETRATALFGWSVPTILALGAAALNTRYTGPAIAAASLLGGAAVACAHGLWPQKWRHAGYHPGEILNEKLTSELEVLESIAGGYAKGADLNNARLDQLADCLRFAWVFFIVSPVAGGIALLVSICRTATAN
jgi:hypothetical protein